jgi:hypothetical protein
MSTSVNTAFIRDYEARTHMIFQLEGGFLRPAVRMKTDIVGSSTTFQVIGKGVATTKARNGDVTPMNIGHTAVECTLSDFYAADDVDKLDEAKTNIDERDAIAKSGAWALGRKVDDQIITALQGTTETTITFTVTSSATVRNSLLAMCEALDDNDVPNDGQRYALLTPRAWSQAMTVEEFASSDYVGSGGLPLMQGAPLSQRWLAWNGVMWKVHTGLPGKGTATANVYTWHKNAVGFANGKHAGNVASNQAVSADIWWNGDRQAHRITHAMSGGACRIDSTGIIEAVLDDTAAIASS